MFRTLRAVRFLFTGPVILVMLYVISRMTSPGGDWFRWAALGIGIAWFMALFRVISAIVLVGGLAAFVLWLRRRDGSHEPTPPTPPMP